MCYNVISFIYYVICHILLYDTLQDIIRTRTKSPIRHQHVRPTRATHTCRAWPRPGQCLKKTPGFAKFYKFP